MKFSAHVWYCGHGSRGQPSFQATRAMLDEIERQLQHAGARPITARCEYWLPGAFANVARGPSGGLGDPREQLARITIEAEPGDMTRRLYSWFQWQHERWWPGDIPTIEGERTALLEHA